MKEIRANDKLYILFGNYILDFGSFQKTLPLEF